MGGFFVTVFFIGAVLFASLIFYDKLNKFTISYLLTLLSPVLAFAYFTYQLDGVEGHLQQWHFLGAILEVSALVVGSSIIIALMYYIYAFFPSRQSTVGSRNQLKS